MNQHFQSDLRKPGSPIRRDTESTAIAQRIMLKRIAKDRDWKPSMPREVRLVIEQAAADHKCTFADILAHTKVTHIMLARRQAGQKLREMGFSTRVTAMYLGVDPSSVTHMLQQSRVITKWRPLLPPATFEWDEWI